MIRQIENLQGMRELALEIASEARTRLAKGERWLLLLDGEMGAGKTQLTRFLTEALRARASADSTTDRAGQIADTLADDLAQSPTFAIHASYSVDGGELQHFDLYRLETEDALESTGFWDIFRARSGLIVIEWAQRLEALGLLGQLPQAWPKLSIRIERVASSSAGTSGVASLEQRRVELVRS